MSNRSTLALVIVAATAFAAGLLFTRPSEAQPKEVRPAPGAVGRYQAVPLVEGSFAVVDTTSGQTWRYTANAERWTNLGIPEKQAK
jgi:hypothetical protein